MNIDIRNIDADFEAALTDIMSHHDEKTASKALRIATLQYMDQKDQIKDQKTKINDLERLLREKDYQMKNVKMAVQTLINYAKDE